MQAININPSNNRIEVITCVARLWWLLWLFLALWLDSVARNVWTFLWPHALLVWRMPIWIQNLYCLCEVWCGGLVYWKPAEMSALTTDQKNYLVYPHLNIYILPISSSLKMIFWIKTFSKYLDQPCSWDALVSMTPEHLKLQGWPTFQAFWCRLCLRTYQNHSHTMVVHSAYSIWPWMKNTALWLGNFIHTIKWL